MNKKLIIITGRLAAGKSAFAARLSQQINIPCLMKDTFKTALCQGIALTGRDESSRFSAITFNGIAYVTERMLEAGAPLILEGNFAPASMKQTDEAGTLKRLIENYGYSSLTFRFTGDAEVLYQRFIQREKAPERDPANRLGTSVPFETFRQWCLGFDRFDAGGRIVPVDTTDFAAVDFPRYFDLARTFTN